MLINCPKCGFSQPRDRYCAKCGVDMETFKPAEKSFISRALVHPALHIGLVFVLVFLAVVLIKSRERKSFLAQVDSMPSGVRVVERTPTPVVIEQPTPVAVAEQAPAVPSPPSAPALPSAQSFVAASATVATPAPEASRKLNMKLIVAEVDQLTLQKWVPEMQNAGQYSDLDFKMGVLPDLQKKMASDRSIVELQTIQRVFDSSRLSHEWFIGHTGETGETGFRMIVSVADPERFPLKGEIKMLRTVEATDPKSFEAEFELTQQSGWVFWNILSPKFQPPADLLQDMQSFFQIYRSARYKSLRSDFTLFFVFDNSASK